MKMQVYKIASIIMLLILVASSANGAVKIDSRRVYNPKDNSSIACFNGKIPAVNHLRTQYNIADIKMAERSIREWMNSPQAPSYFKDLDSSLYHWQFVENHDFDKNRIGVIVILPYNGIREDFYTVLGGGLEIPGSRCYGVDWSWLNDGEILSFVVDKNSWEVEDFVNWRFEQEHPDFDPMRAYYSQMIINYKTPVDLNTVKLLHFVDGKLRGEIPVRENEKIFFPKNKVSTLVFYVGNSVKGVMCFDMTLISSICPMNYESTVYLRDRLGYEKVLYAQPRCEGIYAFSLIEKKEFEDLTSLNWDRISDIQENVATNSGVLEN